MKGFFLYTITGLFILGVVLNGPVSAQRKGKFAKGASDLVIINDMQNNNPSKALPAIDKAKTGQITLRSNQHRAERILIRIIDSPAKNPQIRIAAADALASMGAKKAIPHLRNQIRIEKNRNVKNAFNAALNSLVKGKAVTPVRAGTPAFRGTPVYPGTPRLHGTPRYPGTPRFMGTPRYPGTPRLGTPRF